MKRFKKIYIEITNRCNLNCSFCPHSDEIKKDISLDDFKIILKKIDKYTDYVYLHILGETLIHNKFKEIIELCHKYNKLVNITTNGVFLKKHLDVLKTVRQINISLQSLTDINLLDEIMDVSDELSKSVYISYRLWVKTDLEKQIMEKLNKRYGKVFPKNIFLSFDEEFIWPDMNNQIIRQRGSCKGTINHIGILVDGTVIPCCLDSKGIINLGNIFDSDLDNILESNRFQKIYKGFLNNEITEELCHKCGFFYRNEV